MPQSIGEQAAAAFVAALADLIAAENLGEFLDPDRLPQDDELPALVIFTGEEELVSRDAGTDVYRLRMTVAPWTVRPDPSAQIKALRPLVISAALADRTLGLDSVSDVAYLGASGIATAFGEDDEDRGMAEAAAQDIDFEITYETAVGDPFTAA